MTKELSANIDLRVRDEAKQEQFKRCADPVEHDRQTAEIGPKLEGEVAALFETANLTTDQLMQLDKGKELATVLGPNVVLSMRDQFWVPQLADRYTAQYGDLLYFTRDRDVPLAVISASVSDGGAPQATNPLITQKGYTTPIQVIPGRLVMSFEYDNPKLAEAQASSRTKAIELARYRIMKAVQDVVLAALVAGQYTAGSPFPAAIKYDMTGGHTHPAHNTIDLSGAPYSGNLTLDGVRVFSDYFDELGFLGQKILFVSPKKFNYIKTWASTSVATDTGLVLTPQVINLNVDSIRVHDVIITKKNNVPDATGYGLVVQDNSGAKTLGVYQFGSIQTLPNPNVTPIRSKFDVVVPGLAGVLHNPVATAFVKFA